MLNRTAGFKEYIISINRNGKTGKKTQITTEIITDIQNNTQREEILVGKTTWDKTERTHPRSALCLKDQTDVTGAGGCCEKFLGEHV